MRRRVEAHVDGYAPSVSEAHLIETHLAECPDCAGDAELLRRIKGSLRRLARRPPTQLAGVRFRRRVADAAGAGPGDAALRSLLVTDGGHTTDTPPTWATPREAIAVVTHPPHLRRTLLTAAIVGTILFAINQLDVVMAGNATTTVWLKTALTYLVPFAVSNVGILIASHEIR